jgi:hypothetical protein
MSEEISNSQSENSSTVPPTFENSYQVEINNMSQTQTFFYEALATGMVSIDQLNLYVKFPMNYNRQIRTLSRQMYNSSGLYANVIDYMVNMASLDFVTTCYNNSAKNKKKKKLFNQVLNKINHKKTTRDILMSLLIDGVYVGYLRNTTPKNKNPITTTINVTSLWVLEGLSKDDSLMIQPLYNDYIKIIGFQNNRYVAAFDMMYFHRFIGNGLIGEIKNFPPEFVKAYLDYKKDATKRWFILDQDKTVVLKLKSNINEPWGRPLGLSALSDMLFSEEYTEGQRKNLKEVFGTVRYIVQPMGEKAGSSSLNKEQQQAQYDNFKNAVFANTSDSKIGKTNVFAVAPGTEIGKLENDNSLIQNTLVKENINRVSTDLGFASAALNGAGDKGASYGSLQVNLDLVLCQIYGILEEIDYEYTYVLNKFINQKSDEDIIYMKYLKTSHLTKDRDTKNAKELYTLGMGSLKMWIATCGFDPDVYLSMMQDEKDDGIYEKFSPHPTSFTMSDDENHRPTKNNSELTQAGMDTKNYGGNQSPKPSTR